jgi:hypothetical protein
VHQKYKVERSFSRRSSNYRFICNTDLFFAIYVANIARYNVLYGSIGSIILVMVWVNVNVFLVLMGNELNLAIKKLNWKN